MASYKKNSKKQATTSSTIVIEKLQSIDPKILTVNPGDRIVQEPQTLEDKSKQLAVDAPDITGDHIKVPTYFIVEYPNGDKKALHHVKDAKKISDIIRQAQFQERDLNQELDRVQQPHNFNLSGLILMFTLFLLTVPILIGIF